MSKRKILVLGASGMLGNAVFRYFNQSNDFNVYGTMRSDICKKFFPQDSQSKILSSIDVESQDSLISLFDFVRPEIVINCIGLVKQLKESESPLAAVPINTLLPHKLANLCGLIDARFIHMSTDCVFSGAKGMYREDDFPDAGDVYGRSKFMGEVDYPHAITLRTSIIGHELNGSRSLVGWFLAQSEKVTGYKNAIFSGLPTIEIARVLKDFVIPNEELRGLYHLSVDPINKFDLLQLISIQYNKQIQIDGDMKYMIDRSLDSTKFREATGFIPKPWNQLIREMYEFK
jgi:dTDP-4-dehydrorhamnose reductase